MKLKTELGITFERISSSLYSLEKEYMPMVNIVREALEENSVSADEIINDYESTFPAFNIIEKKANNLLLAVIEIEAIGDRFDRKMELLNDSFLIKTYWELIFTELTSVLLCCVEAQIAELKDFPILDYIRQYRNRFIIHPNLEQPFSDFGPISNIGYHPEAPGMLPTTNFGPGGGADIFCSYHKLKSTPKEEIDDELIRKEVNECFMQMKQNDWRNMKIEMRSKIITYGLLNPTERQTEISNSAEKLFLEKIIPYLKQQFDFVSEKYRR